jgi:hypothetical protein
MMTRRAKIDDIRGPGDGEPWSIRGMLTDSLKHYLVSVAKCVLALKLAGFLRFSRSILLDPDMCIASHVQHEAC